MLNDLKYIDSIYNIYRYIKSRFITLCLSILALITYDNVLPLWVYPSLILLYIFTTYVYRANIDRHFVAHIGIDYILILFIVIGKPIHEYDILLLIATPVINLISCKENLYRCLAVVSMPYLCILINDFICNRADLSLGLLRAYVISICLVILLYSIVKYNILKDSILNDIDQYYLNKEEFYKPHKIYRKILKTIRQHFPNIDIDLMAAFIVNSEPFMLVNSSKIIWRCDISIPSQFIHELKPHKLYPIEFTYDNKQRPHSVLYIDKIKNVHYGYVIAFNRKPLLINILILFSFLRLFCHKYSRVLYGQHIIQQIETQRREDTNNNLRYINQAVNTMHFIRNRLSPFNDLIAILQSPDFAKLKKVPNEELRRIAWNEIERCNIELKELLRRANYLLDNNNNPANYSQLSDYAVANIYKLINHIWQTVFIEDIVICGDTEVLERKRINTNEDGIYIVFSDWIANMKKHCVGYTSASAHILDNDELAFVFINDHQLSSTDVRNLINDLNSNSRNEIMQRTTHGLYNIKEISDAIGLKLLAEREEENIKFTITLKMHSDENISH